MELMDFEIKTVEDLIKVLENYQKDTKITYDYGLPIVIWELDDGSITIS